MRIKSDPKTNAIAALLTIASFFSYYSLKRSFKKHPINFHFGGSKEYKPKMLKDTSAEEVASKMRPTKHKLEVIDN